MLAADSGNANGQLTSLVTTSASYSAAVTPTLTIADLTVLDTTITNQGTRTVALQVQASLPAGLTATAATPQPLLAAQTDGTVQATWSFNLAGGATQDIGWQLRALQAGIYSVPIAVYSMPPSGSTAPPKLRQSTSVALEVKDAAALLLLAQTRVNALEPAANSDKTAKTKAQSAISQALALYSQGSYEMAITQWLAAADALISIISVDTSQARGAVSLAIEATADALCVQRCGTAACQ
jgi:hypothetical protein